MQLVVQSGSDSGKAFELTSSLAVIGRQVGCDILLNDSQVSRRHAQVENQNGNIIITDLGSANGVLINGQRITSASPHLLKAGDTLRLGDTTLIARDGQTNAGNIAPQGFPVKGNNVQSVPPNSQYNYQAPQSYSPPAGYEQPQSSNRGYANSQPQMQGYAAQPSYGQVQTPLPNSQKTKGKGGLIAATIFVFILLAVAIIALVFILGSSNNNKVVTPQPVNTTQPGNSPSTTGVSTTTNEQGASGTNAPPPSPVSSLDNLSYTATLENTNNSSALLLSFTNLDYLYYSLVQ